MVEIGDHLQELADDDGAPCWIIPQVARISIDQRLIDATKVEPPKPLTRECAEPACAVECLSDAGGWQLGAIAGKIDVEAGIAIGAHLGGRTRGGEGKGVSVCVGHGGWRMTQKKTKKKTQRQ